jgi:hypothetical protein
MQEQARGQGGHVDLQDVWRFGKWSLNIVLASKHSHLSSGEAIGSCWTNKPLSTHSPPKGSHPGGGSHLLKVSPWMAPPADL